MINFSDALSVYFKKQGKLVMFSIKEGGREMLTHVAGRVQGCSLYPRLGDRESQGEKGVLWAPFEPPGERPPVDLFSRAQALPPTPQICLCACGVARAFGSQKPGIGIQTCARDGEPGGG